MKKLVQAILLTALVFGGNAWAGKVDINNADAAALMENLEGVGPVKAKAIIDYRKKNGAFKTYDDLMRVPGIGEETVRKNKANLSLSGGITKAGSGASGGKAAEKTKTEAKSKTKEVKETKDKASKEKKDAKQVAEKVNDKTK